MSALHDALADYLALRRALGYSLARSEKLLEQFLAYLQQAGADTVTVEHAVAWATQPVDGSRAWWALRLSAVRGFAGYLHTRDPRCEVPPAGLLRVGSTSRTPFLYSEGELAALLDATATLSPGWRALTMRTLIGLLAVSGIRVGEAIGLDRADLDAEQAVLWIRHGKYGKQRLVPLHPSTRDALTGYLGHSDRRERPDCPALLTSTVGKRLLYTGVQRPFAKLITHTGIAARPGRCSPRIHDLRHTFAVNTLLDCYRTGADVDARLAVLSTYLGHVSPADTYWYLTASPELLALAAQRLEASIETRS